MCSAKLQDSYKARDKKMLQFLLLSNETILGWLLSFSVGYLKAGPVKV